MGKIARSAFVLAVFCGNGLAQVVTSSIIGTVADASDAVVPGVAVRLTAQATGAIRTAVSDSSGLFRFPDLTPGSYTINLRATNFKAETYTDINVSLGETRDMGRIAMVVGNMTTETVQVTAQATPVQTASSEKAGLIDGSQLINVGLKGRDVFSFLQLMPGVLDTSDRNTISTSGDGSISANGNTTSMTNLVDGITDRDVGAASGVHFEPNMDAVQEVKFMASNYQAEYGRNAGGVMTMVTKSGTRDFHGTGWWTHRNEGLNANTYFNNLAGKPVSIYRYNVPGWSFGGPFYIPKHLFTAKNKVFFFASQEIIRQFVPTSVEKQTMPTILEREGNFSQSVNSSGALIAVTDPNNSAPFPGNIIPANRANGFGVALMGYMPLPNYSPSPGSSDYRNYNFFDNGSAPNPLSDTVVRVDFYPTSKLSGYVRDVTNKNTQTVIYQGIQWSVAPSGSVCNPMTVTCSSLPTAGQPMNQTHMNPGAGQAVSLTYVFTPTTVNQFTVGHSVNALGVLPQQQRKDGGSLAGE